MLLLKKQTFEVSTSSALVKGEEAAVVAKAEEIVSAAQTEAAKIADDARLAYEAEKKRGYEEGLAEGRSQILMQKLDLLDESVAFMERTEKKMSEIVMKALKKCVAEIGDQELVVQIVKKSMQTIIRNQNQVTIRVAPEMVAVVKQRAEEIMAEFHSVNFLDVKEDPRLAGAACVVETDVGIVEASVEGQLAAIERALRKNFEKRS